MKPASSVCSLDLLKSDYLLHTLVAEIKKAHFSKRFFERRLLNQFQVSVPDLLNKIRKFPLSKLFSVRIRNGICSEMN